MTESDRSERIARLNDQLRRLGLGGRVVATRSVADSPYAGEIVEAVRRYRFEEDDGNDPYGERDFGAVTVRGEKYYFKIDYYDPSLTVHSEDAADPAKTRRVLTIMHVEEY